MREVEIIEPKLFDGLAQVQIDEHYFDFHNDYNCYRIDYQESQKELILSFSVSELDTQHVPHIDIKFIDVIIDIIKFEPGTADDMMTIDLFYRGRFDVDGELKERTFDNKLYYYLEFYSGCSITLFASKVMFCY